MHSDPKIEIDHDQIKFKNTSIVIFVIVFFTMCTSSVFFSKGNFVTIAGSLTGFILLYPILRFSFRPYLKNSISLSAIDYVKLGVWNNSISKDRNFWGIARYPYFFPCGFNKKANAEIIFVHIKNRKGAVAFAPENCEHTIAVLKQRGIKIVPLQA